MRYGLRRSIMPHLSENEVTPQAVYLDRRKFMLGAGAVAGSIAVGGRAHGFWGRNAPLPENWKNDPSLPLYPVPSNAAFAGLNGEVTPEKDASRYNNFYEFGSHKQIFEASQALNIRPWTVEIDGLVEKPQIIDIDALLKLMPLEERIYRHRCVEAWSMVVPWSGFSLNNLLERTAPLSSARFVAFTTFMDTNTAPGQRQTWYPWPYVEGLTIAEAMHDLTFMVTGIYGHPLPTQHGAPLRLAVPWKYGFKSSKSHCAYNADR